MSAPGRVLLGRVTPDTGAAATLIGWPVAPAGATPGPDDVLVVDEWTPETDPLVAGARRAGARVTCLADLLLARTRLPVLGITGTAGKTTASHAAAALLGAAGIGVVMARAGRAANAWPDHTLVDAPAPPGGWLVAELTSTHLCAMDLPAGVPQVAVVTALWPDHVELHGSVAAYLAAKRRILAGQAPGGWAVLPADPDVRAALGAPAPGVRVAEFSPDGPVPRGAGVAGGRLVACWDGVRHDLGDLAALLPPGPHPAPVLAACTAALCAGVPAERIPDGLRAMPALPHRRRTGAVQGRVVVDDTMAATPAKARAALGGHPDRSLVLVSGGEDHPGGGPAVHADPAERALLAGACREAVRAARLIVLFGPAAARLARHLPGDRLVRAAGAEDALRRAVAAARPGDTVLVAPMFPMAQRDREAVARLSRG
ncbi:MAG: Mur ligase family protein [Thermoleophilia bacterium]|nr:Mur ligase family protein [Thermoleophilia bacterium]